MAIVVIVVVLVLLLLMFELFYERKCKIAGRMLPGPPIYPLIGNAHMFIGDAAEYFKSLNYVITTYGDRCRVFIGPKLMVLLSRPIDVEAVTSSMKFIDKAEEYEYLKPWLGQGLLTSTGDKWKRHRKLLTPAFHFNILRRFIPIIENNVDKLLENLSRHANGQPTDIYPAVTLCALDVIAEATMGVPVNAQTDSDSDYVNAVRGIAEVSNLRMRHIFLRQDVFFNISSSKLNEKKYLKTLFEFTEEVICKRRLLLRDEDIASYSSETRSNKNIAFLDLLLLSEVDGEKLSDTSIKDEVNTFLFEGHDTTASGVGFTLYCIAENEDVQKELYEEQNRIFGDDVDRPAEYSDLQEMKYLELVIKEGLRLYPSVPYVGRSVSEDCNVNGINLPKGSTIVISIYNLQRLPETFDDPHAFRPQRFSKEFDTVKKNAYSYIPFSAGPRNCIGQKFAMMEMKLTISRIIRKFCLRPGGVDLVLSADLILKSASGIHVKITPRN